jgi:hypothetical protein
MDLAISAKKMASAPTMLFAMTRSLRRLGQSRETRLTDHSAVVVRTTEDQV